MTLLLEEKKLCNLLFLTFLANNDPETTVYYQRNFYCIR